MIIKQLIPNKLLNLRLSKRLYSKINTNHYNVIIVGGGMIGSTLACTLGKNKRMSDMNILLLENSPKINYKMIERYSNRVSTLNSATKTLLEDINVWSHIIENGGRYGHVKHMQVWDAISDALITFDDNHNDQSIAYVVENNLLLDSVYKELSNRNNVEIVYQSKIRKFQQNKEKNIMEITMENGDSLTSDLLIGCDGVNSQVRKAMGTHYIKANYKHSGIVATIKIQPNDDENTTGWQRFLTNSEVVALLPLSRDLSSLVWCMPNEEIKPIMSLSDEEFAQKLEERFHQVFPPNSLVNKLTRSFDDLIKSLNCPSSSQSKQIIPKILGCEQGSRGVFPLGYGHATNYIGDNYVLVGDAAHRLHPLAGQGVNLGFGDINCLNQTITLALQAGTTIDDLSYLRKYEAERQSHNILMMLTVHSLFKLYGNQSTPLVLLRSLGLQAVHAVTPLKQLLMRLASI